MSVDTGQTDDRHRPKTLTRRAVLSLAGYTSLNALVLLTGLMTYVDGTSFRSSQSAIFEMFGKLTLVLLLPLAGLSLWFVDRRIPRPLPSVQRTYRLGSRMTWALAFPNGGHAEVWLHPPSGLMWVRHMTW